MTWEQKLQAMNALGPVDVRMRKPRDWYTTQGRVDIGGDGMLSSVGGCGETPELAVEARWEAMTVLPPGKYIVVAAGSDDRKHVLWNGFMWEELPREKSRVA